MLSNCYYQIFISIMLMWCYPYANAKGTHAIWDTLKENFSLKTDADVEALTKTHLTWHKAHPDDIPEMSENAKLYLAYVTKEVIKQKIPAELALIPFVESNYSPFARSHVGATGMWQLMPEMASAHGLVITPELDERRDVIKSTRLAIQHLKYLHKRFHNRWDHAIAAYNAGEGRVRKAIKLAKQSKKKSAWTAHLPTQTKNYLPKIIALKKIVQNPKAYDIELPNLSSDVYFSTSQISRDYTFSQIEEPCKLDSDDLHKLNPSWRGRFIKKSRTNYILVPRGKAFSCTKKLKKTSLFNNQWAYHKVKKNESLENIANHYKTTAASIMSYNGAESEQPSINSYLIVKKGEKTPPPISKNLDLEKHIVAAHDPGPKQIQHTVKEGETIKSISQAYHMKIAHIAYWNQLKYPYRLKNNQKLVLWKHHSHSTKHKVHIVQPKDTVSSIAKQHKITQKKLLSANKIDNIDKLRVNQKINIPH